MGGNTGCQMTEVIRRIGKRGKREKRKEEEPYT